MKGARGRSERWSVARWVGGLVVVALVGSSPARPGDVEDPEELINYAYALAVGGGFGGFSVSGRSVQLYRIPFSYSLRTLEDRPWGVRLTLPVSFGVHDLKAVVDDEAQPIAVLRTLTFVPGFEFQLPVGSETVLKPFSEVGLGHETAESGATVLLYSGGLRTLTTRQHPGVAVSVGTAVKWNGVSGEEGGSEDFGVLEAGLETRHRLRASLAGRRLDVGPYVILRYFYSDLVFERLGAPAVEIDGQAEIGASLGTEEAIRVLGVKLPRLGLGYRFGDGFESWRINFGFPF